MINFPTTFRGHRAMVQSGWDTMMGCYYLTLYNLDEDADDDGVLFDYIDSDMPNPVLEKEIVDCLHSLSIEVPERFESHLSQSKIQSKKAGSRYGKKKQ